MDICLSSQDAIHNEHGRDFMGARIVVEWARGPKVCYQQPFCCCFQCSDFSIYNDACVFPFFASHLSNVLQYDHFSDSYRGGRDRDRDRDRDRYRG